MIPDGWQHNTYGDMLTETDERAGNRTNLPVLSVTKARGPMLASERFGKVMHGRDLTRYRVARRSSIVADPMLLWDGSIGLQAVVDAGLVSPDYRVYLPTERACSDFLAHLVRSPQMLPHYQGGARGTNVRRNRIARSDFLAIPAPLPPLAEQKKIAAILSSVDETIATTQAVIEQFQIATKAVMTELLTHGIPRRHAAFQHTEIGTIPVGWTIVRIGEVLQDTSYGTSSKCETSADGVPVLRIPNVVSERLTFEDLKYARLPSSEIARYRVRAGDLLVIRTNGNPAYVGRAAVVPSLDGDWLYASYLIRLRVHDEKIMPAFLHEALRSASVRRTMEGAIRTSAGNYNLNSQGIVNTIIPLPPLEEQGEIVRAAQCLRARMEIELEHLQALTQVKSALSAALLTGEVRVTPDPEAP